MIPDRDVWFLTLLWMAISLPASGSETMSASLRDGAWKLSSPLGEISGPLIVLQDHDGSSWRCEIGLHDQAMVDPRRDLLHRTGRGWTITCSAGEGFMQPWNDAWHPLGREVTDTFQQMIVAWEKGLSPAEPASQSSSRHRWQASPLAGQKHQVLVLDSLDDLPASWQIQPSSSQETGHLRRRLTTRGRGRGGDGVVLKLSIEDGNLNITSVRWPGRLVLVRQGWVPMTTPAEAYLPLWPLADFIR